MTHIQTHVYVYLFTWCQTGNMLCAHQHFIANHYCKCILMNFLPFICYVCVIFTFPSFFSFFFLFLCVHLQVRTFGIMVCMLSNSIFAFISLKTFPILLKNLNLYGVSWMCAGVCFYGILFSIFILEETKGKNLNECSKSKIAPTTSST